jgi:hypothetical protein
MMSTRLIHCKEFTRREGKLFCKGIDFAVSDKRKQSEDVLFRVIFHAILLDWKMVFAYDSQ